MYNLDCLSSCLLRTDWTYIQSQSPDTAYRDTHVYVKTSHQLVSWQGPCPRKGYMKVNSRWTTWINHSTIFQLMRNLSVVRTESSIAVMNIWWSCLVIRETENWCPHKHFWVFAESIACSNICPLPMCQTSLRTKSKNF